MKKLNHIVIGWMTAMTVILFPSCSNEDQFGLEQPSSEGTPLSIQVNSSTLTKIGGVVSTTTLPNASQIGLYLTNASDGTAYDSSNPKVVFTASGTGSSQVWSTSASIKLSSTKGNVYAYYPYSETISDITSIPIDVTENKDVMWATPVSKVYDAFGTVTLNMNRPLSVIRLQINKKEYSGAGVIQDISVKGAGLASSGTLNAKTGVLTPSSGGSWINFGDLGSLSRLTTSFKIVEQLFVPVTASGLVTIKVTVDGQVYEAFWNNSSNFVNNRSYVFNLTFNSDKLFLNAVNVTGFNNEDIGSLETPVETPISTWDKACLLDGVYAIKEDGSPVPYTSATDDAYNGVGFVLKGKAYQISNAELSGVQWQYTDYLDIPGANFPYVNASASSYTYLSSTTDYSTWTGGALSDFTGKSSTNRIVDAIGSYSYNNIGEATISFRNGSLNQSFNDWYVPACGQLGYMYIMKTQINELLQKCGGTTISSNSYWSSTESTYYYVWMVRFSNGYVSRLAKNSSYYVRFIRDIS